MNNYNKINNNVKITPPTFVENTTNNFSRGNTKNNTLNTAMKSSYFNKNLLTNFKVLGYLCLTLLLFYGCDDEQLKPKEKEPAENLTFQKMTVPFSYDTINAVQILAKVQGKKRGYTLN